MFPGTGVGLPTKGVDVGYIHGMNRHYYYTVTSVQVGAGVVADAVAVAVVATGVGVSSFGFFVAVAVEEGGGVDVALAVTLGVGEAPVGDGVTEGVVLGSKITKGGKTRPDPELPTGS